MASFIACIILFCFIGFAIGVHVFSDFNGACGMVFGLIIAIICVAFDITFEHMVIFCFFACCFLGLPFLIYELIEERKKNSAKTAKN